MDFGNRFGDRFGLPQPGLEPLVVSLELLVFGGRVGEDLLDDDTWAWVAGLVLLASLISS